ncbi:MAG: hypothetical protein LBK12_03905 [Odoribacteraceae bacterium]|jgi:hypothetical protein|nr:hypothetical protein [Odoribacteraceae bacterium]
MKNRIAYMLTLLLALLVASCGTDKYDGTFEATQILVEESNAGSFPAAGGSGTIVLATGEKFTATSDQEWCRLSVSGATITVSVDTNKSVSGRTAMITLAAGSKRNYIPVSQSPVFFEWSVDASNFPANGGETLLAITAPMPFAVTSEQPWCRAILSENAATITVDTNYTAVERTTFVTVSVGEKYNQFTVRQAPVTLEVISNMNAFAAAGGTGSIEVTTPVKFSATSNQDWCETSISGNTVAVTVRQNTVTAPRTATITIAAGEKNIAITVSQNEPGLDIETYQVTFSGTGSTVKLRVDYLLPLTLVPDATWFTATLEGDTIVLEAIANPSMTTPRDGEVIATSGAYTKTITIAQNARIIDLEPDPSVNVVDAFINLKNYNGTSSRYLATTMSDSLQQWWSDLVGFYAALSTPQELRALRFEAPRSSYKYSIVFNARGGNTIYGNSANGNLVPVGGNPLYDFCFNFSATSYALLSSLEYHSIVDALPAGYPSFHKFYNLLNAATGFTIIQDGPDFWFRSIANHEDWIKFEPTTW